MSLSAESRKRLVDPRSGSRGGGAVCCEGGKGAIYVGRDPSLIKHIQNTTPTNNGTRERGGIAIYVGRDPSLIKGHTKYHTHKQWDQTERGIAIYGE